MASPSPEPPETRLLLSGENARLTTSPPCPSVPLGGPGPSRATAPIGNGVSPNDAPTNANKRNEVKESPSHHDTPVAMLTGPRHDSRSVEFVSLFSIHASQERKRL